MVGRIGPGRQARAWPGLGCVEAGQGWAGLRRVCSVRCALVWSGLARVGPGWIGLDWVGSSWAGWAAKLDWVRLVRPGLAKPKRMGWALSPVGLLGLVGLAGSASSRLALGRGSFRAAPKRPLVFSSPGRPRAPKKRSAEWAYNRRSPFFLEGGASGLGPSGLKPSASAAPPRAAALQGEGRERSRLPPPPRRAVRCALARRRRLRFFFFLLTLMFDV